MEPQTSTEEFRVGDAVILMEKSISGDTNAINARVIDIRDVLGKRTYVVETGTGSRKVVGGKQIMRAE
ncbi:MAG: hypothetical protein EG825_18385 [Rhodocyclaceae bacterium]|nr:hypothetical protein [Rhodocyclaceae bacterium]